MIQQNLHCHTRFDDGNDSAEEMVLAAEAAGLRSVGVSLHCPIDGEDWCASSEDEPRFIAEMRRLREKYAGRIEVFCGLEYDLRSARRAVPPYDYIIGSCHYLGSHPIDYSQERAEELIASFGGPIPAAQAYYAQMARLADFEEISVVGHFDLLTKYNERKPLYPAAASAAYRDAAFAAMETLHAAGKIFEINTGAISRGYRTTPYPDPALLRHLKSLGGRICICSDAHSADAITCGFEEAEALARRCGFDELWQFDGTGFAPLPF